MKIIPSKLSGCKLVSTGLFSDKRGHFVKTFHNELFQELKLTTTIREEFFTSSKKDVIRGMHFQTPPHDHIKIVYCTAGKALDVVVDLRVGSSTFGQYDQFELTPGSGILYIPRGLAHGFLSLEDNTVLCYRVETTHAPSNDSGILWSSFDFNWPVENPIISDRDLALTPLNKFLSPFKA